MTSMRTVLQAALARQALTLQAWCLLVACLPGCQSLFPTVGSMRFDQPVRGAMSISPDGREVLMSEGALRLVITDSAFVIGPNMSVPSYSLTLSIRNDGDQPIRFQPESIVVLTAPDVGRPFPTTLPAEPESLARQFRASSAKLVYSELEFAPGQRTTLSMRSRTGLGRLLVRYAVGNRETWMLVRLRSANVRQVPWFLAPSI